MQSGPGLIVLGPSLECQGHHESVLGLSGGVVCIVGVCTAKGGTAASESDPEGPRLNHSRFDSRCLRSVTVEECD